MIRLDLGQARSHGHDLVADRDVTRVVGWISEAGEPYLVKLYPAGESPLEETAHTLEGIRGWLREHGYELSGARPDRDELEQRIESALAILQTLELDAEGGPWWHEVVLDAEKALQGRQ
jgi:hypothetical protein